MGSYPDPGQRFDEVVALLPGPTGFVVTPTAQDGLYYDAAALAIVGKPTRTGTYYFSVLATNGDQTSPPEPLTIEVDENLHDTPVFKSKYRLASAMPEYDYHLDLMTLTKPLSGFSVNNPIHFRIESEQGGSPWVSLGQGNPTVLQGHPRLSDAGLVKEVTLIATSNTGEASSRLVIKTAS